VPQTACATKRRRQQRRPPGRAAAGRQQAELVTLCPPVHPATKRCAVQGYQDYFLQQKRVNASRIALPLLQGRRQGSASAASGGQRSSKDPK
jgi:hypothetical protein